MGKDNVRGPWGKTNKQFVADMRRRPSKLPDWVMESDRLTNELRNTRVMLKRVRRAHMMLTPQQRNLESRQFLLTMEALDAHIESTELQLNAARRGIV